MSERARRRWNKFGPLLVGICIGLLVVAVARARAMSAFLVPTSSMSPTINPGDRVLVQSEPGRLPERGEIWVFQMPPSAMAAPGCVAIKRVMGLPGETIEVREGKVWINDQAIEEAPGVVAPTYAFGPLELGADEYFMLGDNRNLSNDSHVWGPVRAGALMGRATGCYWPMSRVSGF